MLDKIVRCVLSLLKDNCRCIYYCHAIRDGRMPFTWNQWGNNSLYITTTNVKGLHVIVPRQLMEDNQKNCVVVAHNFLNQYKEDGSDLLEWIITGDESWIYFYGPERKSVSMVWKNKRKKHWENSRMSGVPGRWY